MAGSACSAWQHLLCPAADSTGVHHHCHSCEHKLAPHKPPQQCSACHRRHAWTRQSWTLALGFHHAKSISLWHLKRLAHLKVSSTLQAWTTVQQCCSSLKAVMATCCAVHTPLPGQQHVESAEQHYGCVPSHCRPLTTA